MTSQLHTRRTVLTAALAGAVLTACSSTKKSSSSSSTGGEDVSKRLAAAKSAMGKTSGYHVKVTSAGVPSAEASLKAGEGDVAPATQAFKGNVTASTGGNEIKAGVISIASKSWVKPSFSGTYMELNLSSLGVPSPSALFDASTGLPALPTLSTDMKQSGEKLVGGEKVTTFKGTVTAARATKALGFGKNTGPYTVEVGLSDSDQMRSMVIHGPFFDSADATYTVEFTKYGEKLTITKP